MQVGLTTCLTTRYFAWGVSSGYGLWFPADEATDFRQKMPFMWFYGVSGVRFERPTDLGAWKSALETKWFFWPDLWPSARTRNSDFQFFHECSFRWPEAFHVVCDPPGWHQETPAKASLGRRHEVWCRNSIPSHVTWCGHVIRYTWRRSGLPINRW